MKISIVLLYLFAYAPNLQIFSEKFIVHDFLAVLVLVTLMTISKFKFQKFYIFTALLCALIIAMLLFFEKGSAWLVLGRSWVYLSIPMMLKDILKRRNSNISRKGCKNSYLIKNFSAFLMLLFLVLHLGQFMGYLTNPFQMDYYIRALGVPMDEDYYRYAWFDEHHVAAPALLSLFLIFSKKSSLFITWLIAFINGSRMMVAGSILAIYYILTFKVKLFVTVFLSVVFVVVFNHTNYVRDFNDLQLRLINWGLHLSFMTSWHDVLFGYGSLDSSLEKIPIDNFLVRYVCSFGFVGMVLPISMIIYIFRDSPSRQKFFILVYVGAALFNDLFAYPPSLAVFSGAIALMMLSSCIAKQSINLQEKGWQIK